MKESVSCSFHIFLFVFVMRGVEIKLHHVHAASTVAMHLLLLRSTRHTARTLFIDVIESFSFFPETRSLSIDRILRHGISIDLVKGALGKCPG